MAKKTKVKFKKAEESDFDGIFIPVVEGTEIQRTEEWLQERVGTWTGTKCKKLMQCGPGKSKLEWDNLDRLFSFGATAKKIINQVAMERKHNNYINDNVSSIHMKYGTIVEKLIAKKANKELSKFGKVKEVGFKRFDDRPEAGSSSDKIIVNKKKTLFSVEFKACCTWDSHLERKEFYNSDKGMDYWQMVNQVLAHNVKECFYVLASPPHDIYKYVSYQGDVMDLYEEWSAECSITVLRVKPAKIHLKALNQRITVAEQIVCDYLSCEEEGLTNTIEKTVQFFMAKPKRLNKNKTKSLFFEK